MGLLERLPGRKPDDKKAKNESHIVFEIDIPFILEQSQSHISHISEEDASRMKILSFVAYDTLDDIEAREFLSAQYGVKVDEGEAVYAIRYMLDMATLMSIQRRLNDNTLDKLDKKSIHASAIRIKELFYEFERRAEDLDMENQQLITDGLVLHPVRLVNALSRAKMMEVREKVETVWKERKAG